MKRETVFLTLVAAGGLWLLYHVLAALAAMGA